MLKRLKHFYATEKSKWEITKAYKNDSHEYWRWQYNNPKVKTKNALEARILRQTHVIEKGMSLSHPREKFGVQKASELLDDITFFCENGFSIEDSIAVRNALGVIKAYLEFHKERGFVPEDVVKKFQEFKSFIPEGAEPFGINNITKEELQIKVHCEYPEFLRSRHSVRQFDDREVKLEDIQKAVSLAMNAPSACNRQSVKVYCYTDKMTNNALGKLIAGNTGFEQEVPLYLVLTSDISSFHDAFERNQTYVDGGIFCMALIEALHYYGMASCVLQNGEYKERNLQFKEICGNIPSNEKIVLFVAVGYYKDDIIYATSHRKAIEDVLVIK